MTEDMYDIILDDGDDALVRALVKREKGKRLSRKERAIVELYDRLKAEYVRQRAYSVTIPDGPPVKITDLPFTGVSKELLDRIQEFKDGLVRAALVAHNGILVGEPKALSLLVNDFRRIFARELAQGGDDG